MFLHVWYSVFCKKILYYFMFLLDRFCDVISVCKVKKKICIYKILHENENFKEELSLIYTIKKILLCITSKNKINNFV